jgi:hypothetical protein
LYVPQILLLTPSRSDVNQLPRNGLATTTVESSAIMDLFERIANPELLVTRRRQKWRFIENNRLLAPCEEIANDLSPR